MNYTMCCSNFRLIGIILLVYSVLLDTQTCEQQPFILQTQNASSEFCSDNNPNGTTETQVCRLGLNNTSYECECMLITQRSANSTNYTYEFPSSCFQNSAPCGNNCTGNGICVQNGFKAVCVCDSGYELVNDTVCVDMNECNSNTSLCEQICVNTNGSYTCSCGQGYRISDISFCDDINECNETSPCQQICNNVLGSYTCDCFPGYTLTDKTNCSKINECAAGTHSCRAEQSCVNNSRGFECVCGKGFGDNRDLQRCLDIDECQYTRNLSIWQNLTGLENVCEQVCLNKIGSVECVCYTGYIIRNDSYSCMDVNECEDNTDNCEQVCNDEIGSFKCSCNQGYTLNSDNRTCNDNNECANSNNNNCTQVCNNIGGGFNCSCLAGYVLASDKVTCTDIDECRQANAGCDHNCSNKEGNFTCSCRSGYRLGSNQRDCQDINECNESTDICDQICINLNGSYLCECMTGFVLSTANECMTIESSPTVGIVAIVTVTIFVLVGVAVVTIIVIVLTILIG